jgi:hypothetical protein
VASLGDGSKVEGEESVLVDGDKGPAARSSAVGRGESTSEEQSGAESDQV